jgi:RNA recognition motif-containing protein
MAGRGNRVYVGNLDPRATERDVEEAFKRFGTITDIWVARKPP